MLIHMIACFVVVAAFVVLLLLLCFVCGVELYVICLGVLAFDLFSLEGLRKVICTYVLFSGLKFSIRVFYICICLG